MAYVNNIQALALATLAVFMTNAQEQRNHIRTDVMLDSYGLSRMTTIEYYDGLGWNRLSTSGRRHPGPI